MPLQRTSSGTAHSSYSPAYNGSPPDLLRRLNTLLSTTTPQLPLLYTILDVTPSLLIAFYESLPPHTRIPFVSPCTDTFAQRVRNLKLLVGSIASDSGSDVLTRESRARLEEVDLGAVCRGEREAVRGIVEVIVQVGEKRIVERTPMTPTRRGRGKEEIGGDEEGSPTPRRRTVLERRARSTKKEKLELGGGKTSHDDILTDGVGHEAEPRHYHSSTCSSVSSSIVHKMTARVNAIVARCPPPLPDDEAAPKTPRRRRRTTDKPAPTVETPKRGLFTNKPAEYGSRTTSSKGGIASTWATTAWSPTPLSKSLIHDWIPPPPVIPVDPSTIPLPPSRATSDITTYPHPSHGPSSINPPLPPPPPSFLLKRTTQARPASSPLPTRRPRRAAPRHRHHPPPQPIPLPRRRQRKCGDSDWQSLPQTSDNESSITWGPDSPLTAALRKKRAARTAPHGQPSPASVSASTSASVSSDSTGVTGVEEELRELEEQGRREAVKQEVLLRRLMAERAGHL